MIAGALLALLAAAPAMVRVPGGEFRPFFKLVAPEGSPAGRAGRAVSPPVRVKPFWLDVEPVTQAEYLAFVRATPRWRRSQVPRLFADERYLARWRSDLELPGPEWSRAPVTEVSWFAAKAYCAWRGARLPLLAEWELALADEGRDREGVTHRSLEWYQQRGPERPAAVGSGPKNGYGVGDLVGLVWEWTLDFDASPISSDARGAGGSGGLFCGAGGALAVNPDDEAGFMRYAFRSSLRASYTTRDLGFRCAMEAR